MFKQKEIKVLPDNVMPSNYTKMKGSQLRTGFSRLVKPKSPQIIPDRMNNSLEMHKSPIDPLYSSVPRTATRREQLSSQSIEGTLIGGGSNSVRLKVRPRVGTPSAARNYIRTQHATEQFSSEPSHLHFDSPIRYPSALFEGQDESDLRMSISCFNDSYKNSGSIKKGAMTEQRDSMSSNIRAEEKIKQRETFQKKQAEEQVQDWYITQHESKVILSHNSQQNPNSQSKFAKVIERIKQEDDEKGYLTGGKLEGNKKIKIKASNGKTRIRNSGQLSARTKERKIAHMNVINFQEGPKPSSAPKPDQPFHKLYTRLMKQQCETDHVSSNTIDQWHRGVTTAHDLGAQMHQFKKQMQKVKRIPHKIFEKGNQQPGKDIHREVKYVLNHQEGKLQQRKSLMKNYTFKKHGSGKTIRIQKRQSMADDFHVQGWNHSTEFEKKNGIMIL